MSVRQQFCLRGHDTFETGRDGRRRCRTCRDDYELRRGEHGSAVRSKAGCACERCEDKRERVWQHTPLLPTDTLRPFLPAIDRARGMGYADMGGIDAWPEALIRKWYRADRLGYLTPLQADEICSYLGVPTASIYSAEWSAAWFHRADYAPSMGSW